MTDLTRWGAAPWRIETPALSTSIPDRCDVAVIGAGFTGLSAAWHLARRGRQVAVLDASSIGAGASGRTGAIVLEGTATGARPGADRCIETLQRVVDEARIDCALETGGAFELVHRRSEAPEAPLWADGDSTLCIAGAVPGGTMDAGRFLTGLARAAVDAGATMHAPAAVDAIDLAARRLSIGRHSVVARHVVVALNAYTGTLLPLPGGFTPALTLATCTAPLSVGQLDAIGLGARRPFYTIDLPYLWGRTLPDGRVVFGAGLVFPANGDPRSVGIDHPEAVAAFASLEARVRRLHPALAGIGITDRWGGPIAFFADRGPVLSRHPASPDVFVTGGWAGHGVALGVHAGALVAGAILDGAPLPVWAALDRTS